MQVDRNLENFKLFLNLSFHQHQFIHQFQKCIERKRMMLYRGYHSLVSTVKTASC